MKSSVPFAWMVFILLSGLLSPVQIRAQTPWDVLLTAQAAHQKIPVLSTLFPGLDQDRAEEIQKAYVSRRLGADRIGGFKAGLTTAGAQQRFGLAGPVAGVLFRSGRLPNPARVCTSTFHSLAIETEIGFVLGRPLTGEIRDLAALRAAVRKVVPVIELPDLGFADMAALKGVDIIAANVSARKFIMGKEVPVDSIDLNAVEVTLDRDGETVNRGRGREAMGDQWQALLWLANTMLDQGYALEPGQVLITGALGKVVPGKPGQYRADYQGFGTIRFEVR